MTGNDAADGGESIAYRVRRGAAGLGGGAVSLWQRTWVRWLAVAMVAAVATLGVLWLVFARDLPDAAALVDYEPPLPTIVRASDGEIVYSYARERRVQLRYVDFPRDLINAYLAAEDRTFFEHGGVDYPGVAGAAIDYVSKLGSGERARGGSTITQQVAKNILIGDEYSITRKIREALLAYRIEEVLTKEEILELYLNEIYLGRNAYGVQAAAQAYFGKDVGDLELHEVAFLAILPKAPGNYRPETSSGQSRALARRAYVLAEMRDAGWITDAQMASARAMPLGTIARKSTIYPPASGYFVEEVRRELLERYGENAEDGPFGVYSGGLWVRTSLDLEMQEAARDALRAGLLRYHAGKGWRGPIATIPLDDWASRLATSNLTIDYRDWRIAAVLGGGQIGFADGETARLLPTDAGIKAGDVVAVAPAGGGAYALRTVPEVSGGFVAQDPQTGRVLAMQGGFDAGLGAFNRATQAERQPGSSIKPFVYATALDQGMTPATKIVDGTFCVYQSASLGRKCFRNFGGSRGAGAQTMRWGLEQSRNLMTVRAANDAGMDNVVKLIKRVGIGDYQPWLANALGAGETTVLRLTNAYSVLANHGRELKPTLIDYVQDRTGKVIWRADTRRCDRCRMASYDGAPMPRLRPAGKQLIDPLTAFQVVHMLEGVIQRGTAQNLRDLDRPLFGKTGTSTGPTNVWFVGGSPEVVAGTYMGFDQPRPMGGYAQGGSLAAPIFKQFAREVLTGLPVVPFRAPEGIRLVRIERMSGRRVFGPWPGDEPKGAIIWEAFKPDTEPRRSLREEEVELATARGTAAQRSAGRSAGQRSTGAPARRDADFLESQGGIY